MADLLSQYTKLNNSFKKKLVFRLGMEAGFFSEYNNMILAMLYCLEHKIKFTLYSKDANFGYNEGWNDYFLPFCEDVYHPVLKKYNHRYPGAYFSKSDRLKIKLYPWCIYAIRVFKLLIFRLFNLFISCMTVRAIILDNILFLNPSKDLA